MIRIVVILSIVILIVLITIYLYISNNKIEVETFTEDIKDRILLVSDLHSKLFGKGNEKLLEIIKNTKPDIIFLLGDIIDSHKDDINISLNFMEELAKITKTFYISGNHETRLKIDFYIDYLKQVEERGIEILNNKSTIYNDITFIGIEYNKDKLEVKQIYKKLKTNNYSIVLCHNPEYVDIFKESQIVCSGHAHGGQIRIFKKGLFSPGQGLFPKYTSGLYKVGNTKLYVSRGLGGKDMRVRAFNKPHLILLEPSKK